MARPLEEALTNIQKALMAAQENLQGMRSSPQLNGDAADELEAALTAISGALDEGFDAYTRLLKK